MDLFWQKRAYRLNPDGTLKMVSYQIINDQRYSFVSEVALINEILLAGRKRVVFVEGYDDKRIFDIIYAEYLSNNALYFIDISLEVAKKISSDTVDALGGCESVKNTLKAFVQHLPNEKRFFGVIDRYLKTDTEIQEEASKPFYNGRLFIFLTRYTIENYFIEAGVLRELIKDISVSNKKLITLNLSKIEEDIIQPILNCMAIIAAANLTIRYFDNSVSFLESTIICSDIQSRLLQKLSSYTTELVLDKFSESRTYTSGSNDITHKFASAKTYFSCQFNLNIEKSCGANLQINNHKASLARISKEIGIPKEFNKLLLFIMGKLELNLIQLNKSSKYANFILEIDLSTAEKWC